MTREGFIRRLRPACFAVALVVALSVTATALATSAGNEYRGPTTPIRPSSSVTPAIIPIPYPLPMFSNAIPNLADWSVFNMGTADWGLQPVYTSAPYSAGIAGYGNNEDAYLQLIETLDLSDSAYYELQFSYHTAWSGGQDRLISWAGDSWPVQAAYYSDTGTWASSSIDLSDHMGDPTVGLMFGIRTDGSGSGGHAYLDDVKVWKHNRARRIAGSTRYSTAVEAARLGFDSDNDRNNVTEWKNVNDIIIASGEDRAAADPLAAAGLVWAYNAPLFLVSSTSVPAEVKQAVAEIRQQHGPGVGVHIVGGTTSVPDARFTELSAAVGGGLDKDRILATGGRYDLAAAIGDRVKGIRASRGLNSDVVLVANGADSTKFFDALALSAISAREGYPIALVSATAVPAQTQTFLDGYTPTRTIIGGGPATVSDTVKGKLGAQRWSGNTRYTTALVIANHAVTEGWLTRENLCVASKLPDALTAGSNVPYRWGGALILTDGAIMTPETGTWIGTFETSTKRCFVFGGSKSISSITLANIASKLPY